LQLEGVYPFEFEGIEKPYETYYGINVRLRYYLRVTIQKQYGSNVVKEFDFCVRGVGDQAELNPSIRMEVGIEDCLHIEFEYNRSKYSLQDVVVGKVYFLLVRIRIKHMELSVVRRESTGQGSNIFNENETITKFEIMDGAPVRGESIPVRLFLKGFDLTPTYRNINNKFSVRYYLNLVIVDEDDRRYFKQSEITMFRKQLI
jgi:vacuolar protein sorting-associated protein 26